MSCIVGRAGDTDLTLEIFSVGVEVSKRGAPKKGTNFLLEVFDTRINSLQHIQKVDLQDQRLSGSFSILVTNSSSGKGADVEWLPCTSA